MRRASTAERLLAEIAADPDDDAPRQVYADLLVERGDPHGTFIHLQLQRDGLPPTKKELARELRLLTGNARNWVGDLATLFTTDDIGNDLLRLHPTLSVGPTCSGCDVFCRFERGFLVAASLRGTSPVRLSSPVNRSNTRSSRPSFCLPKPNSSSALSTPAAFNPLPIGLAI